MRKASLAAVALLALMGLPGVAAAEEAPTADLAIISNTASVTHARVGEDVTFTSVVRNTGPDTVIDFYVDRGARSVNLAWVNGTCGFKFLSGDGSWCEYDGCNSEPTGGTSCVFDPFEPGDTLTQTIVTEPQGGDGSRATDTACVGSFGPDELTDPNPANDCATATVKIVGRHK